MALADRFSNNKDVDTKLECLDCSSGDIGDTGAQALTSASSKKLRRLILSHNKIGAPGVQAFGLSCPRERLDSSGNEGVQM